MSRIAYFEYGIVRGYATVAEKANVKEGTLVEGDTYYIQS